MIQGREDPDQYPLLSPAATYLDRILGKKGVTLQMWVIAREARKYHEQKEHQACLEISRLEKIFCEAMDEKSETDSAWHEASQEYNPVYNDQS